MTANLSNTQISAIIAKYEEIVRGNTDENWDAVAEVASDTEGDVIYEVWDTANDLGFTELSDTDRDALGDAVDILKQRFAVEVSNRKEVAL
jgi:hypothetical protein